ncbi:MAG: hypothetical protein N2053_07775, partial [Chitinispirillaceae bacterium]|nr:hypothetical protein [Chitinispirillaceae bacterium]
TIERIEDLKEEFGMLETKFKKWEESVLERGRVEGREEGLSVGLERGREEGLERAAEGMIERGIDDNEIHIITGLSFQKIADLRKKKTRQK